MFYLIEGGSDRYLIEGGSDLYLIEGGAVDTSMPWRSRLNYGALLQV